MLESLLDRVLILETLEKPWFHLCLSYYFCVNQKLFLNSTNHFTDNLLNYFIIFCEIADKNFELSNDQTFQFVHRVNLHLITRRVLSNEWVEYWIVYCGLCIASIKN